MRQCTSGFLDPEFEATLGYIGKPFLSQKEGSREREEREIDLLLIKDQYVGF